MSSGEISLLPDSRQRCRLESVSLQGGEHASEPGDAISPDGSRGLWDQAANGSATNALPAQQQVAKQYYHIVSIQCNIMAQLPNSIPAGSLGGAP